MGSWVMASHDLQSCSSSLLNQFLLFFRTFGEATGGDEVLEDGIMALGVMGSEALEDDIAIFSLCMYKMLRVEAEEAKQRKENVAQKRGEWRRPENKKRVGARKRSKNGRKKWAQLRSKEEETSFALEDLTRSKIVLHLRWKSHRLYFF